MLDYFFKLLQNCETGEPSENPVDYQTARDPHALPRHSLTTHPRPCLPLSSRQLLPRVSRHTMCHEMCDHVKNLSRMYVDERRLHDTPLCLGEHRPFLTQR